jgi:hypothetical protein
MNHDPALLFTLRVRLYRDDSRMIVIRAYDATHGPGDGMPGRPIGPHGHHPIDIEVRHGGKVIFPRGFLRCGVNAYTSIDGIEAKELVMSAVAMKPDDTDEDYFAGYTPDQLAWAEAHGEALSCERDARYCDPETRRLRSR